MASQVQCPVCNMEIDPVNAPSETYNGMQYHFCSEGCREQFQQDPQRFVAE